MKRIRFVNLLIVLGLLLGAFPAQAAGPQSAVTGPENPAQRLMNATGGAAAISIHPATGKAAFVRVEAGALAGVRLGRNADTAARDQALAFFETYGDLFGMSAPQRELQFLGVSTDRYGARHVEYAQVYNDVPVFAALMQAHFNQAGDLTAVNGVFIPKIGLDTTPTLSAGEAESRALATVAGQQDTEGDPLQKGSDAAAPVALTARNATLYVFRQNLVRGIPGTNVLVYEVEVTGGAGVREFVYVDAHTGAIVEQFTGVYDDLTRRAFNGEESFPATPSWVEGDPLPNPDAEEGHVIYGAGEIYNLFASVSGGDFLSYDGNDAGMDSVYNAAMEGDCPNAEWTGVYARFCAHVSGDDTVGHEWAHAYSDNTHGLIYAWQSGALSETYSDVWGEAMDMLNGRGVDTTLSAPRTDGGCSQYATPPGADGSYRWLSGEDDLALGAIRDLWNPPCINGDPGKVSDTGYVCDASDGGGVHTNCGVTNHAFALLVDGGTYNGQTITGLGLTKTLAIYWRAQSIYQGPASSFVDHADALEASCADLTGQAIYEPSTAISVTAVSAGQITAADCGEVTKAIAAVEMRTPPACEFTPMLASPAPPLCNDLENLQTVFTENWEAGALGSWTAGRRDVRNPGHYVMPSWHVTDELPGGLHGRAAFGQADDAGVCGTEDDQSSVRYLESADIVLPATGPAPRVAFDHSPATEADYDGGNLKVSVNGGPWQVVPAGAFIFNAYPGELATDEDGNTNPMAGEPAFHGSDEGDNHTRWGQSQVDLAGLAAPGDTIRLRFELGIDGCGGKIGWYVDEVQVYQCRPKLMGALGGVIEDDGGAPLANVSVVATSSTHTFTATSDAGGAYSMTVLADAYTITASVFGYADGVANDVVAIGETTTTQDFILTALPSAILHGQVTDANTGWPLYARIDVTGQSGDATFWNNPETGDYTFTLSTGMTHTLTVNAWIAGYQVATGEVYIITGTIRDFALNVTPTPCTAPGYTDGTVELIRDGGYELGTPNPYWQEYSSGGYRIIYDEAPRTGVYSAWHGGAYNERSAITQTVTIPIGTAELSFWLYLGAYTSDADDWMTAGMDGNTLFTVRGNQRGSYASWTRVALNVSAYADGGAHALHFNSYNDGSSRSNFFVDDVTLVSAYLCLPSAGGLVIGNVYDVNTGLGINRATVTNQNGYAIATAATPGPAVDDGFYTLFSPAGARIFTASMTMYADEIQIPAVVTGDAVQQDFYLSAAVMKVAPPALSATLPAVLGGGQTAVQNFAITNTGNAALNWSICQLHPYDNGPLVNSPGTGLDGTDESVLQDTSLGMSSFGRDHGMANNRRIADDFTLAACATIEEITFFAFQNESGLDSTITAINFQIWDGPPGDPNSRVVFGDTSTNRLLRTEFSGSYRRSESTPGDATRPIMASVADAGGVSLAPGTYWLDWQTGGSLDSGPWAPPITINGQTATGNALQYVGGAWTAVMDGGPQGFPFLFNVGVESKTPWATPSPLAGTRTPATGGPVAVTFDSTGLMPGHYAGDLFVGSNAPTTRLASVALVLDVLGGAFHGLVSDAGSGDPIAGALVTADPLGLTLLTDAGGRYTFTTGLPTGAFTVTVAAFGYFDDVAYPVTIETGEDLTHNVALVAKPVTQVKGKVTDSSGHGWPLYARLDIEGFQFDDAIFTNPATGDYAIALPQDTPFTFTVNAESGGYLPETRIITPTASGPDEDFMLFIELPACAAPGYAISGLPGGGFESTAFPPTGWASFRGANGLGAIQDWHRATDAPYAGAASACVEFEDVAGLAQDWLVTPQFTPEDDSVLTFAMRQNFPGNFNTIYTIRVSTSSQITHTDFITVQTYQETDFTTSYQPFSVSLSAYAGQPIYVAFVMEQDNGDYWCLDDVTVAPGICTAIGGGMLVGSVTVTGTGAGVNGAIVASQEYVTVTVVSRATPDDPALGDGFYSLFVPFTGAHPFVASATNYVSDVQTPTIVAETVAVQNFVLDTINYLLTLHRVGNGATTPDTGVHNYVAGTHVDLSAAPSAGWRFEGWSGDLTGADNPTALTMDGHKEVTATFSALTYTLAVDTVGNGSVTRNPDQTEYLYGDVVTLTAMPEPGWYFGQWSGDAAGALTQTAVTINANKLVTATFVSTPPTYYTLTMSLAGSGVITPGVGAHSYLSGTHVNLSASPAGGWQFEGWSGDLISAANPTTLTMDADKNVTATFTTEANYLIFLPLVLRQ
ncbi:MAG: carboxypeptidase regulatory-like domain-containing protein [Anaerolineae bacterium]|nr:carboxypeptidase regulatory-like domain-containing protein [Anaerolineae bacterium]